MNQLPAVPMGDPAMAGPSRRPRSWPALGATAGVRGLLALLLAVGAVGLPQPATARRVDLLLASAIRAAAPDARPLASSASTGAAQRQVRQQSLAAVRADPDGWIRRYLLRVTSRCTPQGVVIRAGTADLAEALRRGPLLISDEEAKELFPAYARDNRSRALYSGAVEEASRLLTDLLWQRALAQPLRSDRSLVLFSGGGVASGKTAALVHSEAVLSLLGHTQLVQDSTLSDERRARSRIDLALARGRAVQVIYVFTPIEQAVRWLVERGIQTGRTVASDALARSHWQSQATVLSLAERYRDRASVRFGLLVHGPGSDGRLRPIEGLRGLRAAADRRFPDQASFRRYVDALVRQELRARHQEADPAHLTPELERSLPGTD